MKAILKVMNDSGEMVTRAAFYDIQVGDLFGRDSVGTLYVTRPSVSLVPFLAINHISGSFFLFQCLVMESTEIGQDMSSGRQMALYQLLRLPVVDQSSFQ